MESTELIKYHTVGQGTRTKVYHTPCKLCKGNREAVCPNIFNGVGCFTLHCNHQYVILIR